MLINLAPADLLKEGSHFDLPIALAVLAAMEVLPREEIAGYAALGELSLDGTLNPVAGVLPAAIARLGARPRPDLPGRAGRRGGLGRAASRCWPRADLLALINHFRGTQVLTPPEPARRRRTPARCPTWPTCAAWRPPSARWRSPRPAATTCC